MDFSIIFDEINNSRCAAFVYQKEGPSRFRDRLTVGVNGRALFQRYNYGEAAGLVFSMWGTAAGDGITWDEAGVDYGKKEEAPRALAGGEGGALKFDGGRQLWQPQAPLKSWPEGGLGKLKMLFGG